MHSTYADRDTNNEGRPAPLPLEALGNATVDWLARLPVGLRPLQLMQQFPQVVNEFCRRSSSPDLCREYVLPLIAASRQGRGHRLSPGAVAELALLFGSIDTSQLRWRSPSVRPER